MDAGIFYTLHFSVSDTEEILPRERRGTVPYMELLSGGAKKHPLGKRPVVMDGAVRRPP